MLFSAYILKRSAGMDLSFTSKADEAFDLSFTSNWLEAPDLPCPGIANWLEPPDLSFTMNWELAAEWDYWLMANLSLPPVRSLTSLKLADDLSFTMN